MTTLNDYFDKIICINLRRRADRWTHCMNEFTKHGIIAERFEAHDIKDKGNDGCTASHRGVLELICHHKWKRTLILEDDFACRFDDTQQKFSDMIGEVPADWEMLYLGGHYAEKPVGKVSDHIVRIGHMLTTSSYAVTLDFARKTAPNIFGTGPIDNLYFDSHEKCNCYIFTPRLMVQYTNYSDLANEERNHQICMEDLSYYP